MNAQRVGSPRQERVALALLLLGIFCKERPDHYEELDLDGLCQAFDETLEVLEKEHPGIIDKLFLQPEFRREFLEECLEHYNGTVVSLGMWHGRTIIRFKPQTTQYILKIISNFRLDLAWRHEAERACEKGRAHFRRVHDPGADL